MDTEPDFTHFIELYFVHAIAKSGLDLDLMVRANRRYEAEFMWREHSKTLVEESDLPRRPISVRRVPVIGGVGIIDWSLLRGEPSIEVKEDKEPEQQRITHKDRYTCPNCLRPNALGRGAMTADSSHLIRPCRFCNHEVKIEFRVD